MAYGQIGVMVGIGGAKNGSMPNAPSTRATPINRMTTMRAMAAGSGMDNARLPPAVDSSSVFDSEADCGAGEAAALSFGMANVDRWGRKDRRGRPVLDPGAVAFKSAPHTIHLVASSPTRVPQVGHKRGGG